MIVTLPAQTLLNVSLAEKCKVGFSSRDCRGDGGVCDAGQHLFCLSTKAQPKTFAQKNPTKKKPKPNKGAISEIWKKGKNILLVYGTHCRFILNIHLYQ